MALTLKPAGSIDVFWLAGTISSIGAGAAMSDGKKILALAATKATKKIITATNGAMYWRIIFMALKRVRWAMIAL
jgi:hypothetical protein